MSARPRFVNRRARIASSSKAAMTIHYSLCSCCTDASYAPACSDGDGLHALRRDSYAYAVGRRSAQKGKWERPVILDGVKVLDVQAGELMQVRLLLVEWARRKTADLALEQQRAG